MSEPTDLCAEVDASVAVVNCCPTQSNRQRARLLALLRPSHLASPSDVPRLLQSLSKGKWSARDKEELVDAVSGMMSAPAEDDEKGSGQQDFTTMPKFLMAAQWDRLRGGSGEELDLFGQFLQSLGCRNPCERACRIVTCLLMLCTETWERIQMMNSSVFQPMYDSTKKHLKSQLQGVPPFKNLPATPAVLKTKHPKFYSELYKYDGPAACPFSLHQIEFLRSQIRCRGGKKAAQTQVVRRMQSLEGSSNAWDAMAGVLQQTVAQFMEGQGRILDCLTQGGPGPSQPRLSNLRFFNRRLPPSLGDQPSETRSGEAPVVACVAETEATEAGAPEPEATTAGATEPEATEAAEEDQVEEPPQKKVKLPKPTGKEAMDAVLQAMSNRKDADDGPKKPTLPCATTTLKRPAAAKQKKRVFWNLERS